MNERETKTIQVINHFAKHADLIHLMVNASQIYQWRMSSFCKQQLSCCAIHKPKNAIISLNAEHTPSSVKSVNTWRFLVCAARKMEIPPKRRDLSLQVDSNPNKPSVERMLLTKNHLNLLVKLAFFE